MNRIFVGALSLIVWMQIPGPAVQMTVTGEVRTPGPLATDKPTTLLAAITQAGGFTADAAVIEIHRRSSGAGPVTATTPPSDYQTLYVARAELVNSAINDPLLVSGDFIVVRRVLELHAPAPAGQFGAGAYRLGWTTWGVSAPLVRTSSEPQYTRAGMVLKLQGTVQLEVVVKADGTVGDARVIRGLDAQLPDLVAELRRMGDSHSNEVLQIVGNGPIGLDANAIECVRTWTFVPGTILGKATPVIQPVSVPFKLR